MRNILVTGAAGALGSEVVKRFHAEGYHVLATDLKPVMEQARLRWMEMDVTDVKSVRAYASRLHEMDVFVHCAGGFRVLPADQTTGEDFDFLFNVNLRSAFLLLEQILPGMKQRNYGRIVFIGSLATLHASAGMAAYAASKAGLNVLTTALATEVKDFDINVNTVIPTVFDTPANRQSMPSVDFSSWIKTDKLAEIIFFLTQPSSQLIHGALIPVAGRRV